MKYTNLHQGESRDRLVVLTDMENEPDDSQTMVRLLMYSNEIDIEGLIAVTSRWVHTEVFPESIVDRIHAFGIVRPSLEKHASGWPSVEHLLSVTGGGQEGYGMDGVGEGKSTRGSELIIAAVDRDDPRPVNVAINAGANTLAQAIWDVQATRSDQDVTRFVSKIRVFDDSGQDNAGAWIAHTFPDLFYARSRSQVFGLYGPTMESGPYVWGEDTEYEWIERNVRVRHGILGALYPQRLWIVPPWNHSIIERGEDDRKRIRHHFTEGGGTGSWLGLAHKGVFDADHINWGGWGGRYKTEKEYVSAGQHLVDREEEAYKPFLMYPQAPDTSWAWGGDVAETEFSGVTGDVVYTNADFAPIWRWRDETTRDFQARMDWCICDHDAADHPPKIVFEGDDKRTILQVSAAPGEVLSLDASASHGEFGPVEFVWMTYPEAGTYLGDLPINLGHTPAIEFKAPDDSKGKEIHILVSVTAPGRQISLTASRRLVIGVS